MSRLYIGDYTFNGLFEAGIAGPVDARYIVEYFADLTNTDTWPKSSLGTYIYEGMQVYVKDEKKVYILTDVDNYTSVDSWKELASDVDASIIEIVDDLNSDKTDAALSAKQGNILRTNLEAFKNEILVDDKINTELLPQFNTGLVYGGTIDKDGNCKLTKTLKDKLGFSDDVITKPIEELSIIACSDVYFIANEYGTSIKINENVTVPTRYPGDWIISDGSNWEKISSNAVASVVGKTGIITAKDITDAIIYPGDGNPVGYVASHTEILRLEGVTEDINREISTIKDDISSVSESLTWKTI